MPTVQWEKAEEYRQMVRIILTRTPNATVLQTKKALASNGYELDKGYVCKIMQKVRGERVNRLKTEEIGRALAEFEDTILVLEQELYKIIFAQNKYKEVKGEKILVEKAPSANNKTRAIEALAKARGLLLDKKFDAGVFERKLGTIKTEALSDESKKIISTALDYVHARTQSKNPIG
jgi:hypothetical protein